MTRQEEIREGIEHVITVNHPYIASKITEKVLEYLHSQGVVIQVEIPRHPSDRDYSDCGFTYEPLMKGE